MNIQLRLRFTPTGINLINLGELYPQKVLLPAAGRKWDTPAAAAKTLVPNGILMWFVLGCKLERKIPRSVKPEGGLGIH